MSRVGHFFAYNNLVPIVISVVLLGSSATYAYNNPEVVYERNERVVAIDNTYIAAIDFDRFSPSVEILAVEEDDETYYVSYRLNTIALTNSVWQNVTSNEEMIVSKASLGAYRDLGLYVTKELRELVLSEEKRLRETQVFEKRNVTRKQLAIEYSGIIGGRLSPEVQTIEGYDPQVTVAVNNPERQNFARPDERSTVSKPVVISAPQPATEQLLVQAPPTQPQVAETVDVGSDLSSQTTTEDSDDSSNSSNTPAATSTDDTSATTTATTTSAATDTSGGTGTNDDQVSTSASSTSTVPTITLLGPASRELAVGDAYTELGIVVSDSSDTEPTTIITVDGVEVSTVTIDTSIPGEYTITYQVTNVTGAAASITRTVRVVPIDPVANTEFDDDVSTTTTTTDTDTDVEAVASVDGVTTPDPLIESSDEPVVVGEPDATPQSDSPMSVPSATASSTD